MKPGTLTLGQIFRLAAAECRGSLRRFVFFIICIAIGVGAVMTLKSVSNLVQEAIQVESKSLLAADIEIKSSWEQNKEDREYQKRVLPPETQFVNIKELNAMARFPDPAAQGSAPFSSLLIELKSIPLTPPLYPIYGRLKTGSGKPAVDLLSGRGALVEAGFLTRTRLRVGDRFDLGNTGVEIRGVITAEPDRVSRAFSLGPRVFVSHETLEAARLIQPGSRVRHKTLVGLPDTIEPEKALALLERGLSDKSANIRTYKDMQSSLTDSVARMEQYLGSVGVIALLMGGIGVAMIIRTFMAQKLDTIAILNCLGASPASILKIYFLQALFLGAGGSALGVGLGYGLQYQVPAKLGDLLALKVEPGFYAMAAVQSFLLGLIVTLLFCAWPLLQAARTRPMRLFRLNLGEEELSSGTRRERLRWGILFVLVLMAIIFWQSGSLKRAAVFLSALGIAGLLLSGLSLLTIRLLKKLPPAKSMAHRYGLANLSRPNNQATSIVTCLGMGIMLVLTVRLVQMDMLAMLQAETEVNPPNYFFIDIQSDQTDIFLKTLDRVAPRAERTLTPLIRSRLYSADGKKVENWEYTNRRDEEWFVNREFVLTYMDGPPPKDNEVIQGRWWSTQEAQTPQVSLEEDAARRLNLKIGSTLTMDIQGIKVSARVTSIRKVNWRNMRTNFYMIFSPGALAGAPITFVSTVHVPQDREIEVQKAIVNRLPNITALSTRDIADTVQNVANKLMTLVDFMSGFAIIAGLFILSGSVASTKFRRLKESAILKILGARRTIVTRVLAVEYAVLGLIAGGVGVGLSLALSWSVMKYLVKAPWHPYPGAIGLAFLIAVGFTTLTGIVSSLDVLIHKPIQTLRRLS